MNTKCECVQVLYSQQWFFAAKALCTKKLGYTAMKETFFCPKTIPAELFWKVSSGWIYCTSNGRANLGLQTALIQVTRTLQSSPACSYTHGEKRQPTMESQICSTAEQLWSNFRAREQEGMSKSKMTSPFLNFNTLTEIQSCLCLLATALSRSHVVIIHGTRPSKQRK